MVVGDQFCNRMSGPPQVRLRGARRINGGTVAWLLVMALAGAPAVSAQQPVYSVVVNESNPVTSLTRSEVSNLFLRKLTRWSDGSSAHPVDLPANSPIRAAFSREIHGKSVASVSAYWQQQIFSGRSVPPPEKPTPAEVIAYVRSDSVAIGYIPAGSAPAGLKVIKVQP